MLGFRGRIGRGGSDDDEAQPAPVPAWVEPVPARPAPETTPAGPARTPPGPALTPAALLARDVLKRRAMVSARVVADQVRCVECGVCSYNCPLGIDVRGHVRMGLPISDHACLTCGECVARCPRGTLRFEESSVFTAVLAEAV